MSSINAFLQEAARRKTFAVTHVRPCGPSPVNESCVAKWAAALHGIEPSIKLSMKIWKPELPSEAVPPSRHLYAMACASFVAGTPGLQHYLSAFPGQEPIIASMPPQYANGLARFDLLQALGRYEFGLMFSAGIGAGGGIAGAMLQHHLAGLRNAPPSQLAKGVDSVFQQSFADAFAIYLMAATEGRQSAGALVDEVIGLRRQLGDFDQFSITPLSQDTEVALLAAKAKLSGPVEIDAQSRYQLASMALVAASMSMGAWLEKNKLPAQRTAAVLSSVDILATGIREASSKLLTPEAEPTSWPPGKRSGFGLH